MNTTDTINVIAHIQAKEEHLDAVLAALLKLIEPTRKEAGCLKYELFQDNNNKNLFIFVEQWESHALLQQHLQSEHIAAYIKATEGLVDLFVIHETTHIA